MKQYSHEEHQASLERRADLERQIQAAEREIRNIEQRKVFLETRTLPHLKDALGKEQAKGVTLAPAVGLNVRDSLCLRDSVTIDGFDRRGRITRCDIPPGSIVVLNTTDGLRKDGIRRKNKGRRLFEVPQASLDELRRMGAGA